MCRLSVGLETQPLTSQAQGSHLLLLLLAEGSLLGRQRQGDAPVVVRGAVTNHLLKCPLHEVHIFPFLGKYRGKNISGHCLL